METEADADPVTNELLIGNELHVWGRVAASVRDYLSHAQTASTTLARRGIDAADRLVPYGMQPGGAKRCARRRHCCCRAHNERSAGGDRGRPPGWRSRSEQRRPSDRHGHGRQRRHHARATRSAERDRKSTRLNSSHVAISYAVFCLKKKKEKKSDQVGKSNQTYTDD